MRKKIAAALLSLGMAGGAAAATVPAFAAATPAVTVAAGHAKPAFVYFG